MKFPAFKAVSTALGFLLLITAPRDVRAQGGWRQSLEVLNLSSARSIAMGGAVTSMLGDLEVALYNPASVELYRYPQSFRITFCLDPVSPVIAAADRVGHPAWRELDASEQLAVLGLGVRGLLLRWNFFDAAISLGKDLSVPGQARPDRLRANWHGFPQSHGHFVAGRLRLAREVAIGASVFYAQRRGAERVERGYGVSYGVLVTSREGLRFGVSYVSVPEAARRRLLWEGRLVNGTVNLGLSRTFGDRWTLALDVRNLSDEGKPGTRELHLGSELLVKRHLVLRAGVFQESRSRRKVLSAGFGLIDRNEFVSPDRFLRRRSFVLEYAARATLDGHGPRELQHFLTLLLRI